jgi:hypothetical protein
VTSHTDILPFRLQKLQTKDRTRDARLPLLPSTDSNVHAMAPSVLPAKSAPHQTRPPAQGPATATASQAAAKGELQRGGTCAGHSRVDACPCRVVHADCKHRVRGLTAAGDHSGTSPQLSQGCADAYMPPYLRTTCLTRSSGGGTKCPCCCLW